MKAFTCVIAEDINAKQKQSNYCRTPKTKTERIPAYTLCQLWLLVDIDTGPEKVPPKSQSKPGFH